MVQKQDLVRQTTGLSQVVRGHDHLCAGMMNLVEQRFHGSGCGWIKTGGGFIEEQHLGFERPGTCQSETLLFPTRQDACRSRRQWQQRGAGLAVLGTVVGIRLARGSGQFGGGLGVVSTAMATSQPA